MARKTKQKPLQNLPGLFDDFSSTKSSHKDVSISFDAIEDNKNTDSIKSTISFSNTKQDESITLAPPSRNENLRFFSLGSGSSGNCAYLGDSKSGILIDAGVDNNKVVKELEKNGISMDSIKGICITHDHGDHIRYAYSIVRRYRHIGIYCTPKALNGIMRRHNISRRFKDYHRPFYKEIPFEIDNFKITAFEVSHDGTDNVGFFIENGAHRFAIATDLGCITPRVDFYMRQAQYIMIESNYDLEMLMTGKYAEYLKARILADNGHLDNAVTARYISDIYSPKLSHIFLCHLSNDNNTPNIALSTVTQPLFEKGYKIGDGSERVTSHDADVQIMALPRFDSSILYILRANQKQ